MSAASAIAYLVHLMEINDLSIVNWYYPFCPNTSLLISDIFSVNLLVNPPWSLRTLSNDWACGDNERTSTTHATQDGQEEKARRGLNFPRPSQRDFDSSKDYNYIQDLMFVEFTINLWNRVAIREKLIFSGEYADSPENPEKSSWCLFCIFSGEYAYSPENMDFFIFLCGTSCG